MKRYLLPLLIATLCLAACSKVDNNGDLGGAWQLVSQTEKDGGAVVATKENYIFYYFSRNLMRLQQATVPDFYLCTFRHTADSLFIGEVHATPDDALTDYAELALFGVTPTGRFGIDHLDRDRLVLSNERYILTFRKY